MELFNKAKTLFIELDNYSEKMRKFLIHILYRKTGIWSICIDLPPPPPPSTPIHHLVHMYKIGGPSGNIKILILCIDGIFSLYGSTNIHIMVFLLIRCDHDNNDNEGVHNFSNGGVLDNLLLLLLYILHDLQN